MARTLTEEGVKKTIHGANTALFLLIVTLFAVFHSSNADIGNLILVIVVANFMYPVIPVFIVILFVIGYVIDKRIGKK